MTDPKETSPLEYWLELSSVKGLCRSDQTLACTVRVALLRTTLLFCFCHPSAVVKG